MWDYEFWLNIMMNCENRKAYGDAMYMIIWTMIDLGGELISWVSQVILRKSIPLSPLRCDCWYPKLQEKTSQRCRRHFRNTRDIHAICWFCVNKPGKILLRLQNRCIYAKESLRRPLNKSRHQNPPGTRTIIQGTAYRYGTFHPEMPWQALALWTYLCGSKVAPKKIRPPRSWGNSFLLWDVVWINPLATESLPCTPNHLLKHVIQVPKQHQEKLLFVDNLMFQNSQTLSWLWVNKNTAWKIGDETNLLNVFRSS